MPSLPDDANTGDDMDDQGVSTDHAAVVVVGAGFAGIAAAAAMRAAGRRDFLVLERADDVGGTWRDNTYPGCACDVPSHLYSLSSVPNPAWTRSFSTQPEIQGYLRTTAARLGVTEHVRLRTELLAARWDEDRRRWRVSTSNGALTCDVLVLATGPLSTPAVPALPGLDRFAGVWFHSGSWDHDHDLDGARVGVVGTGASAAQFVPHLQRRAGHLVVFQRTAPWVLPRRDRPISPVERAVFRRVPSAQRLVRGAVFCGREAYLPALTGHNRVRDLAERRARRHLRNQVPDPVLRDRLTPRYRLGCKRVLLSDDYYPALTRHNVELVDEPVVEVLPHAVVSEAADGARREHAVDTLVFGTGFRVTDPPIAHLLTGRDGTTLAQRWSDRGMQALHGTTVTGFPNLFLLAGPNTGLGHNSVVYMIESQVRYVLDALRQMTEHRIASVEPRPEVEADWNAELQDRLAPTVWNTGGCRSWYLDAKGRNTTLWPTFTFSFRRRLRHFDLSDYLVRSSSEAAA